MGEKIEILPASLLQEQRPLVQDLRRTAQRLGLDFGWHYLLDLVWILDNLGVQRGIKGMQIMDAGAGVGVLQWFLAQQGADVISVDRLDRSRLAFRFRSRYSVSGLGEEDLLPAASLLGQGGVALGTRLRDWAAGLKGTLETRPSGRVILYHQDLGSLKDIADASLDAVVSVSALEHNTHTALRGVVQELMRVLKPGGKLLATLCAGREADWFHEPSKGWCYTASSLRDLFALPAETPDNYATYELMLEGLRNCAELRDNLARFYFQSGDNGMPWGKWDPQYLPVGVCKIKG